MGSSKDIDDILSSGPCSPQSEHGSAGFDFSSVELVEPQNLDNSEVITLDVSQELLSLLAPVPQQPQQQSEMVVELDPAYSPASQPSPAHSFTSLAPSASPAYSYYSDDPSDPPYSPGQELRTPVFRSKPYERPRKPGSSRGLPKEVIQQERK